MENDPCKDCGQCCTSQESPPMLAGYLPGMAFDNETGFDADLARSLPQALKDELMNYMRNLVAGIRPPHATYPACLWYDPIAKRCKHYEFRPSICREFLPGESSNRYRREVGLTPLTISRRKSHA